LHERTVGTGAHVVHAPQDPTVHGLEAVTHVGQGTRDDDRHGVVEERPFHLFFDLDGLDEPVGRDRGILAVVDGWGLVVCHGLSSVQMSMKRASLALFWMNFLRASTSSPMSVEMAVSAAAACSTETCNSVRLVGSMVVDLSSCQSISPKPFSRANSL